MPRAGAELVDRARGTRRRRSARRRRSRPGRRGRRAARAPSRSVSPVVVAEVQQRELVDRRVGKRLGRSAPCRKRTRSSKSPKRSKPSRTWLRSATRLVNRRRARAPVARPQSASAGPLNGRRPRPCGRRARSVEVGAHEDRAAAAPDAARREVARDPLGADRVQALARGGRARCARSSCTGRAAGRRASAPGARSAARRCSRLESRVAHIRGSRSFSGSGLVPRRGALAQVLEPDLVLEVVLVEQRPLDDVQVPAAPPVRGRSRRRRPRRGSGQLPHPQLLGQLEPARAGPRRSRAGRAPRPSSGCARASRGRQRRSRARSRPGRHDHAHRVVVLGDEVLERGHHAVARPALARARCANCGVEPAVVAQLARPGTMPPRA